MPSGGSSGGLWHRVYRYAPSHHPATGAGPGAAGGILGPMQHTARFFTYGTGPAGCHGKRCVLH